MTWEENSAPGGDGTNANASQEPSEHLDEGARSGAVDPATDADKPMPTESAAYGAVPPGPGPYVAVPPGPGPYGAVPPGAGPYGAVPPGAGPYGAVPPGPGPYGAAPSGYGTATCQTCGADIAPGASVCGNCQAPVMYNPYAVRPSKDKTLAGVLGLVLGGLGVHKFYLGYNTAGGIMLGITIAGVCTSFLGIGLLWVWIPSLIGLIEGVIYLTKSDEEFYNTYVTNERQWF